MEEVQEQPSEEVASCGLAEPTHDAKDEAATSAEAPSACRGECKQPSKRELAYMRLLATGLFTKPPLAFAQYRKVGLD